MEIAVLETDAALVGYDELDGAPCFEWGCPACDYVGFTDNKPPFQRSKVITCPTCKKKCIVRFP